MAREHFTRQWEIFTSHQRDMYYLVVGLALQEE
ncbi:uncharacterized protein METZ01_LOCUS232901 [marine metagenome]|uniref:Uncharacterized protein n=1 Tax=marine metagenome TaxID=408172 RepID=A0A382GZA0_9ZZZZ